jgi:hypothetical protein
VHHDQQITMHLRCLLPRSVCHSSRAVVRTGTLQVPVTASCMHTYVLRLEQCLTVASSNHQPCCLFFLPAGTCHLQAA